MTQWMSYIRYMFLVLIFFGSTAHVIVVPYPTRSLADNLLDANTIVLAKESAENPFTYEAHTAIKGSLGDVGEIDLYMNSHIRRLLNQFPERNMVLFRSGDGEKQKWKTVGTPDPEIDALVKDVLAYADHWEKDTMARLDFFAERIRHSNSTIRDLAHLEIGRAPYSEIRKMKGIIPSNEIYAFLRDIQYVKWHALHILLLGLSDNPYDQKVIEDAFHSAAQSGTSTRLAAWTTAYLEIEPEEALISIESKYFNSTHRELEELHAVVTAISAHGNEGHIYLRDSIVKGYKTLLKNYPDLAIAVVNDLIQWQRWELVETYRNIMKDPPPTYNYVSFQSCRRYIQAAHDAKGQQIEKD